MCNATDYMQMGDIMTNVCDKTIEKFDTNRNSELF